VEADIIYGSGRIPVVVFQHLVKTTFYQSRQNGGNRAKACRRPGKPPQNLIRFARYAKPGRSFGHTSQIKDNTVSKAMMACEMTQYRHHTSST
jgi:hypothetical protein